MTKLIESAQRRRGRRLQEGALARSLAPTRCHLHPAEVRDVTNAGAQIRLNGLNVLPPNFELSFDNFRTVRKCRLIWRRGDFIGIAFEN